MVINWLFDKLILCIIYDYLPPNIDSLIGTHFFILILLSYLTPFLYLKIT
jgi:hypothetical protein